MFERLGGMAVLERQLFTLRRAGFRKVFIAAQRPRGIPRPGLRIPVGLETVWAGGGSCAPPFIGVSGDHLVRLNVLRELLRLGHERATAYQDPAGNGVVQVAPFSTDGRLEFDRLPMPPGSCLALDKSPDKSRALEWLLGQARKETDSFMSKHFDRRLSLALTRRLLDTRVKPNHMTLVSASIGLLGAVLMADGGRAATTAGALVVWAHTLLDGCDGELARLRFQESRFGGLLDFWGDNLIHFALFLCLGVGQWRRAGGTEMLVLGSAAAVAAVAAAWTALGHSSGRQDAGRDAPLFQGVAEEGGGRARSLLARLENTLAQRDFIYLLVLAAAAGRLDLFVWAAGVGTPLFFLGLLVLRART